VAPPKPNNCGAIIVMIVAVVVTAIVAPWATTQIASLFNVSAATLAAGGFAAGAVGVAGAFVGGVAGSIASQVVGKAIGAIEHFSLKDAVVGGITNAIGAGLGKYLKTFDSLTKTVNGLEKLNHAGRILQGVGNYTGSVVANAAVGRDANFSWSGVAAAAVGAGVSSFLGGNIPLLEGGESSGSFPKDFVSGFVNGAVNATARRVFGFGKQDWGQIAIDAFGNAAGNAIAGRVQGAINGYQARRASGMSRSEYRANQAGLRLSNALGNNPFDQSNIEWAARNTTDLSNENILASIKNYTSDDFVGPMLAYNGPLMRMQDGTIMNRETGLSGAVMTQDDFDYRLAQYDEFQADIANLDESWFAQNNTTRLEKQIMTDEWLTTVTGQPMDQSIISGTRSGTPSAIQRHAAENDAWVASGAKYYDQFRGTFWGDVGANAGTYAHDAGVAIYSGVQMLYDLGTDSQSRTEMWTGVKHIVTHPVETYQSTVTATSDWMGKSTAEQMRTIGSGGFSFVATAGTQQFAAKSLESLKSTTFVMRPLLVAKESHLGSFSGVGIPSPAKLKLQMPVVSIKTVTPEMRAAFKDNGYLNPMNNELTPLKWYEKNAVDHIYPAKEIKAMDGFDRLTPDQMRSILQDKLEFGNLQPLPTSLNSSKGAQLKWEFYKGKNLDKVYAQDLMIQQQEIAKNIQKQIQIYTQINKAAGIK
jgi:hypothetical protein